MHKFQAGLFLFSGSQVKFLLKGKCHNFRTSYAIEMKLRPLTWTRQSKYEDVKKILTFLWKLYTSLSFFWFSTDQSGSRTPIRRCTIEKFDQYLTFILQNPKAELKYLQHKTHLSFCKTALFLTKNCQFLHNADINKLKMVLVIMCVFYKTAYLSIHLCQYSSLGVVLLPHPPP